MRGLLSDELQNIQNTSAHAADDGHARASASGFFDLTRDIEIRQVTRPPPEILELGASDDGTAHVFHTVAPYWVQSAKVPGTRRAKSAY